MPFTHPIPRSRLAPPHEARVQATRPDGVLVGHPGEEPLQAETVSAVRRGAVPKALSAITVQVGREMTRGDSLPLVGVPVVGLVGDAVLLVRLDQLVVVVHPHGAADDLPDAGHWERELALVLVSPFFSFLQTVQSKERDVILSTSTDSVTRRSCGSFFM